MGANRSTFGKLERDRAKRAKAAAKRERRQSRSTGEEEGLDESAVQAPARPAESTDDLLAKIEALHQRFEAKLISHEDFEEEKADLFSRLSF